MSLLGFLSVLTTPQLAVLRVSDPRESKEKPQCFMTPSFLPQSVTQVRPALFHVGEDDTGYLELSTTHPLKVGLEWPEGLQWISDKMGMRISNLLV
jgi:hypothetical protein